MKIKIVKLLDCYIAKTRGFTLVELLVAIAVLGILATVGFLVLNPAEQFQKARDARRKSDLSQIQKAIETFYQDNGKYPDTSGSPDYNIKNAGGTVMDWGTDWTPYMGNIPKDPADPSKKYIYNSTGQTYYLYASLDGETNVLSNLPVGAKCGTKDCNYGVSSPNVNP